MLLHILFHATVLVGLLGAHGDTAVSWHLKREHGEPETKWPPTRPYIVCLSSLLNTISAKHAGYLMQLCIVEKGSRQPVGALRYFQFPYCTGS